MAEALPPGCPPQPPAKQHGQSPAKHMDSLRHMETTTSKLRVTLQVMETPQLNLKPHATQEQSKEDCPLFKFIHYKTTQPQKHNHL